MNANQIRIPMTRMGYEKLKKEIDALKSVERPKIVREVEEARAHGDLSENAEYHAAREKLGHIEGRLRELETKLSQVQVVESREIKDKTKVVFGAFVTLLEVESEVESTYQIVGEYESDIHDGRISMSSPIGKAVIGKIKSDLVRVLTPKGSREFEIVQIEYR